jgi:aminoglycoside phosphotransferase (APT) family kinase protein
LLPRESVKALSRFVCTAAQANRADVTIECALPGNAERLHYLAAAEIAGGPLAGRWTWVVRGQADEGEAGLASVEEFAVRQIAFSKGLTTPEPLWLEPSGDVLGMPFMILRHVAGSADAAILQDELTEEAGDRLAYQLGQELARLHAVRMEEAPAALAFLPRPDADWMQRRAAAWRAALDGIAAPQPCFEWAVNWLADRAPSVASFALCHRGLRLGSFAADGERLTGIFDLDQVGWSDPMEDLGWLTARGGRRGLPDREAGGIGSREALYDGYREIAGSEVDDRRVRFWEIAAALRQGIASLRRAARPAGDPEQGLAARLDGLQSLEAEYDLLLEIEQFTAEAA